MSLNRSIGLILDSIIERLDRLDTRLDQIEKDLAEIRGELGLRGK